MGASLKIFIVNRDDSLQKLSVSKFERLLKYDSKERMPEHAGKRVRYVLVIVEYKNRRPIKIIQKQYSYLTFDLAGRLDPEERKRAHRLAQEAILDLTNVQEHNNVIDAKQLFAKNKFVNIHSWISNNAIEIAIVNAIFREESPFSNNLEPGNINELF